MNRKIHILLLAISIGIVACQQETKETGTEPEQPEKVELLRVSFEQGAVVTKENPIPFDLDVAQTGRYRITVYGQSSAGVWVEDYVKNIDDRTYNISGSIKLSEQGTGGVEGSPMAAGEHPMQIHADDTVTIDSIHFQLMLKHEDTPTVLEQKMDGEEWTLVWSDEFDGSGLPDPEKWNYNIGNWGWGNNEPQYYTAERTENARQEDGNLIIEAHKNDLGNPWTSARLTTQGKIAFQYGKVEFRAKVPAGRGTWAAGWLLGDAYQDELSWPYCGEIDVLECVGYEIDDETGKGLNHATCHTRAYYFKQGNQIGSEIELENMNTEFHTYAIEWYPDVIHGFLDGEKYFTYDKVANEREWPFGSPQNIIVNLAVGGGWGGAKGIDESYDSHQYILDYVRVYAKQ